MTHMYYIDENNSRQNHLKNKGFCIAALLLYKTLSANNERYTTP